MAKATGQGQPANKRRKLNKKSENLLHEEFHKVLLDGDFCEISPFLEKGIKLCQNNKGRNCYVLAQERPANFLRKLLEYDPSGVNAKSKEGYSLLMRDIETNGLHTRMLLDLNVNVNYCNKKGYRKKGYTALHFAAMNVKTSYNIFKQLIDKGADVNKQAKNGETPLICLLKNYDQHNGGLKKVKLLINSGADINLANKKYETPLKVAIGTDLKDKKLNKYLLEHGADIRIKPLSVLMQSLPNTRALHLEDYIIPTIDLLLKHGDDILMKDSKGKSALDYALELIESRKDMILIDKKIVMDLINYLINLSLKKLREGLVIEESNQCHPMKSIIKNFSIIVKDVYFLNEIDNFIFNDELKTFPPFVTPLKFKSRPNEWYLDDDANTLSLKCVMNLPVAAVLHLPLENIKHYLIKLKENGFDFTTGTSLFSVLLKRFPKPVLPLTINEQHMLEIIDYLLEIGHNFCSSDLTGTFQPFDIKVPDCLWLAGLNGRTEYLKKLLPHWKMHPLTLLYYYVPNTDNPNHFEFFVRVPEIVDILPLLIRMGGPVSHGSELFDNLRAVHRIFTIWYARMESLTPNGDGPLICIIGYIQRIMQSMDDVLQNDHPVSLQVLCRTVIRNNLVVRREEYVDNVINSIRGIPDELKNFLIKIEVDDNENSCQ